MKWHVAAALTIVFLAAGVASACSSSSVDEPGVAPEGGQPPSAGPAGTVYLTFDDGPGPFTSQVLDILRRTDSTATFFQLGMNRLGYEEVVSAVTRQGSNIGNHTYSHVNLTEVSAREVESQIARGPEAKCFRPPYGASNPDVQEAISKAGLREVLWDVDSEDWTQPGVEVLRQVGADPRIKDQAILLMHDGGDSRQQTVVALPSIIEQLQARGFVLRALPYC